MQQSSPNPPLATRARTLTTLCAVAFLLATASVFAVDADLDPSFGGDGKMPFAMYPGPSVAYGVAVQPDGKVVAVGKSFNGTDADMAIARLNPDGSMDYDFGTNGRVFFDFGWGNDYAGDVAIQPDGKIVVVGGFNNDGFHTMGVVRFNGDGSLDDYTGVPFNGQSYGHGIALQSDGKIVVSGKCWYPNSGWDFAVARLNSDLSMDTSFSSDGLADWDFGDEGLDCAYDVAVDSNGDIVTAGTATWYGQKVFGIMWWSSTGGPTGLGVAEFTAESWGFGLALQPDHKAVMAGTCATWGGDFAVARFLPGGLKDPSFSGDGMATVSHSATASEAGHDVVVQLDGKIVIAGYLTEGGYRQAALVRWKTDGELDWSFNDGNPYYFYTHTGFFPDQDAEIQAAAAQPDGKIVVAGSTGYEYGIPMAVARFAGDEDLVFADDLELGTAARWSSTLP